MIAKKSNKADLERKRFAFFQIGLIVAGSVCLVAFEYTSANVAGKVVYIEDDVEQAYTFDEKLHDIPEQPIPQKQNSVSVTMIPIDNVTISVKALASVGFTSNTFSGMGDAGYGDLGELIPEDIIYEGVDKEPEFPGGDSAMAVFIKRKTEYPEIPREMGIQGIVYVGFIVNKDGSISEVNSKNSLNADLEREAMRVIRLMPNWIPGEQAGKPVRVRFTVPINFLIKP